MFVQEAYMSQDQIQKITDKLDEVKTELTKEIQSIKLQCAEHVQKINILWDERSKRQDVGWKIISTLIAITSVIIAVMK